MYSILATNKESMPAEWIQNSLQVTYFKQNSFNPSIRDGVHYGLQKSSGHKGVNSGGHSG